MRTLPLTAYHEIHHIVLDMQKNILHKDMTFNITTLSNPSVLYIPQVSFLLAEQITEAAKTCVCPHLMDESTAVAVGTGSYWKTTPALVREENFHCFRINQLWSVLLIKSINVAEFQMCLQH